MLVNEAQRQRVFEHEDKTRTFLYRHLMEASDQVRNSVSTPREEPWDKQRCDLRILLNTEPKIFLMKC